MYHKEVRVVKLFKRAMPILLSAAMAASMLLPAAAANQGSGETTTTATEGSYDKSIVMVDAGRKYFSVDSLKSIIDSASSAGMHYVMLGLGNDGMRFLLDDMSLTVGDTTYTSEEVSTAIHAGNEAYSDFEVDELTEDDMDAIMSHADSKGVEIIPLINTPGHMDAILDTAEALTGSPRRSSRSTSPTSPTRAAPSSTWVWTSTPTMPAAWASPSWWPMASTTTLSSTSMRCPPWSRRPA